MLRRITQMYAGLLLICGTAALAQTGRQATPAHPLPPPAAPAGPNASAEACGDKIPDGGAPWFIRAETAEQRKARIGAEDPGCDPEPAKEFWRFGHQYTVGKYDKQWAVFASGGRDENYIRPFGFVNSYRELYQQNSNWVWVWEMVPEVQKPIEEDLQKSTAANRRYSDRDIAYLQKTRAEFFELTPKNSSKTIRFEAASDGLPTSGSWRNGLAVADMNGDGFLDIIAPPERAGGTGAPAIFLGDGKGHWRYWQEARWTHALDYGAVAAGDFNKDGKMDLAFAVHLRGIFVVLNDGKGTFNDVSEGLPRDFPTRRLLVKDVDGDGYPDIVALSEGPTAVQNAQRTLGKIRVYYNRKKGTAWEGVDVAAPEKRVGGDYLSVGNFNGDRFADIAAASIYSGSADVVYMSKGPKVWTLLDNKEGTVLPMLAYYLASTTARYSSKKTDDLILSYVRFWPTDVNPELIPAPPLKEVTGLDRISFGADRSAKRTPIARWGTKFGVSGMATGDFDGDGNLDIAYTTPLTPELRDVVILLGDGKGNFEKATIEGFKAERKATYDLKVADVNGDGRPDIIIMYEADQVTALAARDGSIQVFLNRGPAPAKSLTK